MHFDDRLATVLRARADSSAVARIVYRQLLDLLGTQPVDAGGLQVTAAYDRLNELGCDIPSADRAAMVREPGMRLRNPRLVALLAASEPPLSSAAIEQAQLTDEEWLDLAPVLPAGARSLVRQRGDLGPRAEALFDRIGMVRRGLPPAAGEVVTAGTAASSAAASSAATVTIVEHAQPLPAKPTGIGAIVQRIEDFRKARAPVGGSQPGDAPHLPFADTPHLRPASVLQAFDFATDAEGRIVWSDPGMAPMAVGLRLASRETARPASATAALALALRQRQPLRSLLIELDGAPAIAGPWLIDAAAGFDGLSGNYSGHAGRMRRPQPAAPAQPVAAPDTETDRMRQLLHELRTPINAIQGFAEVIQQQLFGPAPHEYRALAAAIAGDAAQILAGFEELERLAQLEGGVLSLISGNCDLGAILKATAAQLEPFTQPRSSGFALQIEYDSSVPVAMPQAEAERLVWRLMATLAGAANPGEVLRLRARVRQDRVKLTLQLPARLAAQDDAKLMRAVASPVPRALSAGMFGTGFSLRLAAAEAKAAGGELRRRDKNLQLRLPVLTGTGAGHSGILGSSVAN